MSRLKIKEGTYKYIVNTELGITIFPKTYFHDQIGTSLDTLYGGFIDINEFGTVGRVSDYGSETLRVRSITIAKEETVFTFIDKINSGNFEYVN